MEDGPCGEPHEGGQFCMSHDDCGGDTPFCYEYHCNSCAECHFCHDGVDGTCGSCGDGFPTMQDGPCGVGGCPTYCIPEWIGDSICDMYDCEACDDFTVDGVFDGGDCEGGYEGGDYDDSYEGGSMGGSDCFSHDDCGGDMPFCYDGQCDSCQECHYCHDGIDGTCGPCGDGYPLYEGSCGADGDSDCPSMCTNFWVGDGWCDDGVLYHVDCTPCEHFTDADGVLMVEIVTMKRVHPLCSKRQSLSKKLLVDLDSQNRQSKHICLKWPRRGSQQKRLLHKHHLVVLPMMIAVETHHSVTRVIVILVKNVTSVTTELMAPADRVEMVSRPRKMAPAVNLMKVDNFACRIAIVVETHHFVTNIIAMFVKNVTSVTTELMAPAVLAVMGSPRWKMSPAVNLMANFVCRTAIAKVTHHSAMNINATLAQSAISATMALMEPVDLAEMGSRP